ncbi:MAG: hypothetical protein R3F55_10300 [Alphaproteobacteria bacterium]
MPAQLGHINYAPADLNRAVDRWHHDTLGFDYVLMVNDPASFAGGRFQYFMGTKAEAAALAAEGREPPADRVVSPHFPGAGWAVLQQGNMVVHRGGRLEKPAERITFINGYVARDISKPDPSRLSDLTVWDPPHVVYPNGHGTRRGSPGPSWTPPSPACPIPTIAPGWWPCCARPWPTSRTPSPT